MKESEHPDALELIEFARGGAGKEKASEIESHLKECGKCRDKTLAVMYLRYNNGGKKMHPDFEQVAREIAREKARLQIFRIVSGVILVLCALGILAWVLSW